MYECMSFLRTFYQIVFNNNEKFKFLYYFRYTYQFEIFSIRHYSKYLKWLNIYFLEITNNINLQLLALQIFFQIKNKILQIKIKFSKKTILEILSQIANICVEYYNISFCVIKDKTSTKISNIVKQRERSRVAAKLISSVTSVFVYV